MNYSEFLNLVNTIAEENFLSHQIHNNIVKVIWTTGGVTGGSCWGSEANMPVSADPEPDFDLVDLVLEKVKPNISFLVYKNLMRKIVSYSEDTSWEYYGNCTNHSIKTVDLRDLYDELFS